VDIARNLLLETPTTPDGGSVGAKQFTAHVVVNADNLKPFGSEEPDRLGSYQSR
jgi:hypothetical protein